MSWRSPSAPPRPSRSAGPAAGGDRLRRARPALAAGYDPRMPTATAERLTNDAAREFISRTARAADRRRTPRAADGRTFETIDPATGEPICEVAQAGADDVDRAVGAARAALEGRCARSRASKRAGLMYALAELIKANGDELAELESLDNGKPLGGRQGRRRRLGRPPALLRGLADEDRGRDDPGLGARHALSTRCASRSASAPRSCPGTSRC